MKCTHCSREQADGAFCSKCGHPLSDKKSSSVGTTIVQDKHRYEAELNSPTKKSKTLKLSIYKEVMQNSLYTMVPALIITSIIAWIFTLVLQSSIFIKDYTYILFSQTLGISDDLLIEIVTQIKVTVWDVLVVAHMGLYKGTFTGADMETIMFNTQLSVVIAPVLLGVILVLIFRFARRKLNVPAKTWLQSLSISAIGYGLIMTIIIKFLEPTYETNEALYELSTSLFTLFIKATFLFLIAGGIGLKVWTLTHIKLPETIRRAIIGLRPFIVTLLLGIIGLCFVIVIMWSTIHPAEYFTKPLTTPASLWSIYNRDPLFYLLLPTFLLGELIYALGNSLVVSTMKMGEFLQLSNAIKMNAITGVKLLGEQDYDASVLKMIQKSTRFMWYMFVFLIVYLFSLNRIKTDNIQTRGMQIIIIGLTFGIIASVVSFTLTTNMNDISGTIGFSVILTSLITMIVSGFFFVVKHLLMGAIERKVGEKTG